MKVAGWYYELCAVRVTGPRMCEIIIVSVACTEWVAHIVCHPFSIRKNAGISKTRN